MKKIFSIIFLFLFTNLFAQREFYELRTYEIKWGTNSQILNNFLKNSFLPVLNKNKVKNIGVFTKISKDLPNNIYVLIPYSSIDHFNETYFNLQNDKDFKKASLELNSLSNSKVPYERYSVSHFYAFEGFPKIRKPEKGMSIFELRDYESPTDDAYLRKVKMFNNGEFEIFDDGRYKVIRQFFFLLNMKNKVYLMKNENCDFHLNEIIFLVDYHKLHQSLYREKISIFFVS